MPTDRLSDEKDTSKMPILRRQTHHTKLYGDCKEVICSECEATVSDLWDYTKDDNGIRKRDAVEVWNSRVK